MPRPGRDRTNSGRPYSYSSHTRRPTARPQPSARAPRPPHAREAKPMPIGDRCNPACPLFRCLKNSLMVKLEEGKLKPYCMWAGDICIGHTCQYASCSARYMLPDGRCLAALKARERKEESFEEEIEKELKASKVRGILSRRGLSKDLESELL